MSIATETPSAEIALVDVMRAGRRDAFEALIQANNRRLFRIARGILRDEAEAEEVVQETYAQAFAHLDGFRGEAELGTWLARIAINEAMKRQGRARETLDLAQFDDELSADGPGGLAPAHSSNPEHAAARAEIRQLIEHAIDKLPSSFRVVFIMRAVEQMSVEETATGLGIPPETVKTRLHRATRRLRASLGAEFASIFDGSFPFAGARCDRMTRSVLARMHFPDPASDPPAA